MGSPCAPLLYLTVHAPETVATNMGSVSHTRALVSSGASGCCWGCSGFLTHCHVLGGDVLSWELLSHTLISEELVLWLQFLWLAHRGTNSHGSPIFADNSLAEHGGKCNFFLWQRQISPARLLLQRESITYLCSWLSCFYPRDHRALTTHLRKPRAGPGLPLPRHLAAIQQTIGWVCRILSQHRPCEACRPRGGSRDSGVLCRARAGSRGLLGACSVPAVLQWKEFLRFLSNSKPQGRVFRSRGGNVRRKTGFSSVNGRYLLLLRWQATKPGPLLVAQGPSHDTHGKGRGRTRWASLGEVGGIASPWAASVPAAPRRLRWKHLRELQRRGRGDVRDGA